MRWRRRWYVPTARPAKALVRCRAGTDSCDRRGLYNIRSAYNSFVNWAKGMGPKLLEPLEPDHRCD